MAERGGDTHLVFTAFFSGMFRLYRMPLRESGARDRRDRAARATRSTPSRFEPPLTSEGRRAAEEEVQAEVGHRARRASRRRGRRRHVPEPTSAVQFSDLMGNHRVHDHASTRRRVRQLRARPTSTSSAASTGAPACSTSRLLPEQLRSGEQSQQTDRRPARRFLSATRSAGTTAWSSSGAPGDRSRTSLRGRPQRSTSFARSRTTSARSARATSATPRATRASARSRASASGSAARTRRTSAATSTATIEYQADFRAYKQDHAPLGARLPRRRRSTTTATAE